MKSQKASKVWNEVLNPCRYFRHHNCCKPFFTGGRRPIMCDTPNGCCKECDEKCPLRCKENV